MAMLGGGLICWSLGHFIGWWALPLTAGTFLLLTAVVEDIIDEVGK